MATIAGSDNARGRGISSEERFVIFASSLGTVFEWYDFYLYAILAPFFAALFLPPGNEPRRCSGRLPPVALALLGATAGQGVVWYTGQFYALFFPTLILKVDPLTAYEMIGLSLLLGTPFFIVFGWLSDRIGRLKIILAGCIIAAQTYFPLFAALTHYVNPDLERFQRTHVLTVTVDPATCQLNAPWNIPTPCDAARDTLTKAGLSFATEEGGVARCQRSRSRAPAARGRRRARAEADGLGSMVRSGSRHRAKPAIPPKLTLPRSTG